MRTVNLKMRIMALGFIIFSAFFAEKIYAQLPMVRSTFNGVFSPINSGVSNGGTLSTASGDDAFQDNLPLGFTFNYLGTNYTALNVSTNGVSSFNILTGVTTANQRANVNLFNTTAPANALAPWWDDLTGDSIIYKTTGSPGSQVFTAQWYCKSYFGSATQGLQFQVKLYEGTNVIEFLYGTLVSGTFNTGESASIGIKNGTGGPGNFIDAVTGSSFVGTGFMTANTKWPTRFYRFTPGSSSALAGGTYNVGTGQTYPTLDEAVADINHRGISGPIMLSLTQSLYDVTSANGDNIFPVFFGPVAGLSAVNSITVQPVSGTSTLSYAGETGGFATNFSSTSAFSTANEPIIATVGANNIIFNNLYLTGASGTVVDRGIAFVNYSPNLGTSFCSVKNCSVSLDRSNTSSLGFETRAQATPTVTSGSNSNNTFMDVSVQNVYNGMFLSGNASFPDVNNMITSSSPSLYNSIGGSTANDIGNGTSSSYGIQAANQSGVIINNNIVQNVSGNGSVTSDGILLNALQGTSQIRNNKVMNIRNNSTSATNGVTGIRVGVATTGTHEIRVYNNFVSGITSAYTGALSATRQLKGISAQIAGGGANTQTINIDFNNVSIDGSGSPNISNTCYEIGTTSGPIIRTRNNVFANFTAAQTSTARHTAWVSTSATAIGNTGSVSNYNDLYIANSTQGFVGLGNTTTYATLANWQTAMSQDANSQSCDPVFVNNFNDPHALATCIDGTGNMAGITWVIDDIDNTSRSSPPDIGADEFTIVACSTANGGTQTTTSYSRCAGQTVSLSSTGASVGLDYTYQWQVSTTAGGPYSNVSGGSGANTTAFTSGTLSAGTYYYVLLTTCSVTSVSGTSNESTVTVNALPSVNVTPLTGTICMPGGVAVSMTANGASTYSWTPSAGLSATTGSLVNALPSSSTVYTITGTALGCSSIATATVTIGDNPSINITASPTTVCSGGSSNFQVGAGLTDSYTVTSIPYSAIAVPPTASTLCASGSTVVALTSGSLDDGYWSNLNIPFNFSFFGVNYTNFAVATNGVIFLGGGNPATTQGYANTFPSTAAVKPSIATVYADLDFDGATSGSNITYFTVGASPNQKLVVNWSGQFYNNTGTVTTQAIIYETSNIIEVHTFTSTGTNASVEGIQNSGGTVAYPVTGRNNSTWTVSTPDAYRWTPNGGTISSYAWTPSTFLSASNISNPVANNATTTTIYTVTVGASNGCSSSAPVTLSVNPVPSVSVTGTSSLCAGTNATLTASGATTYSWSTGATTAIMVDSPLTNTTYTVDGTSNGCTGSTTVAVSVVSNPTVVASASSPTVCSGATATLNAVGATSYTWSTGGLTSTITDNPTSNATYTVTGETSGCVGTDMVTVSVTPNPTVSASASASSICSGSSSTLTAVGATSYTWSSGPASASTVESPSVTTTYTVTGESSGCVGTDMITLTVTPTPSVNIATTSSVICSGNTVTLTATGATSYTWSTGAMASGIVETPTVGTTYSVTGDNSGCTGTATIAVSVNPSPVVTAVSSSTMICVGQSATLTASGANTYTWSTGTTAATTIESPTTTVSYTVTGEDVNGCTADFIISQSVSPCTGIESAKGTIASVQVYPNPNNGLLNIVVPDLESNVVFELYDALGKTIAVINLTDNHTKVNIADIAVGIYSYRIKSGNLIYGYGKLVRE